MNAKRGYYSLIQFCPDPSRAEAVNVGIALFCPDAGFLGARTAAGNRAAAKLVGRSGFDRAALNAAKRAIERRLEVDRASFQTLEDFQRFAETRANVLKFTAPRPVKVVEPEKELELLFQELVGGRPRQARQRAFLPPLDNLFRKLQQEGRARLDITVTVPLVGRRLHIPYAYRNGDLNLVKPQVFSSQEGPAVDLAMRLAVEGDLLQRHGAEKEGASRLIVVPTFDPSDDGQVAKSRVRDILGEYHVRTIPEDQVDAFVAEVEQQAH